MKKRNVKQKLSIYKMNIADLNLKQMQEVVAGGPRRSIKNDGECWYSRHHYTQCTSGDKYSLPSVCVECS
ncbi:hypothetical protein [Kordia sp.]|uniref:hypothetical protein n=1 Tax=Kordia sp. TaxID=1965332 RepID=UPI003B5C8E47